jgi:hypothetical protein
VSQWLEVAELEDTTQERYQNLIRICVNPTFGDLPASNLDAELLERLQESKKKETKSRQQRWVAIDPQTVERLKAHRERCEQRCAALGCDLEPSAFLFSPAPMDRRRGRHGH